MANKLYKVTETQFKNVLETIKKEREITETPTKEITETITDTKQVFEAEFGYMEIDVMDNSGFEKGHLFKMVPEGYDIDFSYRKAKVKYDISLEYRSYGIKNIYVHPISVFLSGELIIEGENGGVTHDFEIEYGVDGLKSNTLSGDIKIDDQTIKIGDLPKEASFDTEHSSNNHGVWVDGLSIEESIREFKFKFQY